MWHGSVEVGHAVATCWHCRAEGLDKPHSLGYWECSCELGEWAKGHAHGSEEAKVWADGLTMDCNYGECG